jgi:SAM-dependent methyltransferase
MTTMDDKMRELFRYDERARVALQHSDQATGPLGTSAFPPILRSPYRQYERFIRDFVQPSHRVLELGAGVGAHTDVLMQTGAYVTATDLSPASLQLLDRILGSSAKGRLTTRVADMEQLPFESATIDVVACAGSLSYGEPDLVDGEVRRVLRPGGAFICVDSFNHNPIYRLNRWVQYRRGRRSKSTLLRMPKSTRIDAMRAHYASVEVAYFGAFTWAMPPFARLLGQERAAVLSDALDRLLKVRRSAFKFVLIAHGRL